MRGDEYEKKMMEILEKIICGKFVQENSEDLIITRLGKVKLNDASSGQQESLPMLLVLMMMSDQGDTDIFLVEEPETHLFPEAQQQLMRMLAEISNYKQLFIATHSPFIL